MPNSLSQTTEPSGQISPVSPTFPEFDLSFYRKLGRTDLTVSCLGIGGGGSFSSEDTLYAFEQGINYFFYSSDLHHFLYSSMSEALRELCGRGSSVREKVVLATVTYVKTQRQQCLLSSLNFWNWELTTLMYFSGDGLIPMMHQLLKNA